MTQATPDDASALIYSLAIEEGFFGEIAGDRVRIRREIGNGFWIRLPLPF